MTEEASLEFTSRKIDGTKNYLLEEKKHNDLMNEKQKTWNYLNYVENLLILVSTVNGCGSISAFASLLCVPVGITSSTEGIKIYVIIAGFKKYKSIIQKKKKAW